MIIVTFLLLSGLVNQISCSVFLENVCSGKEGKLFNIEEVKSLINQFDDNKCSNYKDSFVELNKVLSDDNLNDICSDKTYEDIKSFHRNFISTYLPEGSSQETTLKPIPKALRNYFISFASDIALSCTKNLIERFENDISQESTFQLREIDEFRKVREMLLIYMPDEIYKNKNIEPKHIYDIKILNETKQKIHLLVNGKTLIKKLTRVVDGCNVRYNKISQELFEPVIRLNNLGYGINRLNIQETMSLLSHKYVPFILTIDTCQLLNNNFDIIIDNSNSNSNSNSNEDEDQQQPKLINLEEASKLHMKLAESDEKSNNPINFDSPLPLDLDHKSIEFTQLTEQKNHKDVVAKFESENARLIKTKFGGNNLSLNEAFGMYEQEVVFTTEKPTSMIGKVITNWGRR